MIPKIIHQTAPLDKSKWHPLWNRCQQSWKDNFKDFEYKLWNDEQIDNLVKEKYPEYWNMYNEFPIHIMKIDFVRLCFMHQFGGIYADMDYFCYKNFYDELTHSVYLVENPFGNDPIENSLMCSSPGHNFWIECMELSKKRFNEIKNSSRSYWLDNLVKISADKHHGLKLRPSLVFYITGTNHLSSAFRMTSEKIKTLDGRYFNNNDISYHPSYRTKHIHTGLWGKESINVYFEDPKVQGYLRNISLNDFNFYYDYSNGKYLKEKYTDFDKNDADENIKLDLTHYY